MKTSFYQYGVLLFCSTAGAYGLSLYETAPAIGLPESHAIRNAVHWRLGYDTNPSTSYNRNGNKKKKSSAYTNASLSSSYSDIESIDKISYKAHAGATYYFDSDQHNGQKWHADCGLTASMSHSFSAQSRNSISTSLTYKPEPEYDDSYSNHGRRGDCFTWNIHDNYSQAIDSRWSWHVGANYSGTKYTSDTATSWNDDRQYIGVNTGFSYKESDRTSYSVTASTREELRRYGVNTHSYHFTLGANHSISPVSSMHASLGLQAKVFQRKVHVSPTLSGSYNRVVAEGVNVNFFTNFSNENTDSYRGNGSSYRDVYTLRSGLRCSYAYTPTVSYNFGASLHSSFYGGGQNNMKKEDRHTYDFSTGMTYKFSDTLTGNIRLTFSHSNYGRQNGNYSYNRLNSSCGISYSF